MTSEYGSYQVKKILTYPAEKCCIDDVFPQFCVVRGQPHALEKIYRLEAKIHQITEHMKIHTDVRNYKCQTCGKAFYRAKALREHIRTHTKHLSVTYVGTDLRWQFISGCITTRDVFYVRREVDLMKTAKVNAYIMHIFGKIELLSIHAI